MNIFNGTDVLKQYPRSKFSLSVPSINLPAGTITGVVGENGNGKTTLLNIIAGELSANGKFSYFDNQVKQNSNWQKLKNNIAFIPQRIPKWFGTLEQNLYLKAGIENIPQDKIETELNTLLDFLDLQRFKHLKWSEISTGYRLRFELARVLIGNPKLLVLDEPLANLDINTQQKFLSDLKSLLSNRDYQLAVILSSQQLHEIESVADQMLFLRKGQTIFSGNLNEIAEENTQNIFELQLSEFDKTKMEALLHQIDSSSKNNGPYLQISSNLSGTEMITKLLQQGFEIKYFRNLSNSTKRFFSE